LPKEQTSLPDEQALCSADLVSTDNGKCADGAWLLGSWDDCALLFAESALNEEAGKLLLENYADYAKHARLMTSIHAQPSKRYAAPV